MKKLIFSVIMMLVIASVLKSQDRPSSPLTFSYRANDTLRVNEPLKREYFIQKEVILGTQWYGHPRMLKALKMQVQQGTQPDGAALPILPNNDSSNYKMYHIWDSRKYDNALGFEYKPTLYISETDRGKLITNANDPSRPIFGFSHRDGTIEPPIDSGDENFRLGLYPNDLPAYNPDSVVLKKTWITWFQVLRF
ncbi:MAG: hypothetical protein KIT33_13240 [Candidatus Kapabacteria bacterium]|nr:hypothetical protein [Ignavibacteriota bacterium]MCW5885928.1 hypothetical protein [Candidatus Kapabacteria bacterium]